MPEPNSPSPAPRPQRKRWLWQLACLLLAVAGGLVVQRAWRATQLREASNAQLVAAVKADAHNSQLWTLLGARLAQAGLYPQASWTLHNALENGSKDPLCWTTEAATLALAGRPGQARQVLQQGAQEKIPELNEILERVRQLPASAPPTALATAISPDGATPLINRAAAGSFLNGVVSWWGRHHPESSGIATREAWASEEPNNPTAQRLWGEALYHNGAIGRAISVLNYAVVLAPDSTPARVLLAQALTKAGQPDKATEQYQICLKQHPNDLAMLLALSETQLQQGQVEMATSGYERATRLSPQSVESWIGLGRADLQWSARGADAVNAFAKAAQLAPERTDFYDDYAESLRASYQLDEAEKVLRRRLQAAPEDARAHYLLGSLLARNRPDAKRQQEAEAELRLALKYVPDQSQTELELAQLLLRTGKPQAAVPLLRQVIAQDGLNATAVRLLSAALRQLGQVDAARVASEQADKLTRVVEQLQVLGHLPNSVENYRQTARLYASVGQTAKAQEAARQAQQFSQHH